MTLPESAKDLIRSGALGHLSTIGRNGAPQVTGVWVAVDGDDLLTAHLNPELQKLKNVRRDPRVTVSFQGSEIGPPACSSTWWSTARRPSRRAVPRSSYRTWPTCTWAPRCASPRWTTRLPA